MTKFPKVWLMHKITSLPSFNLKFQKPCISPLVYNLVHAGAHFGERLLFCLIATELLKCRHFAYRSSPNWLSACQSVHVENRLALVYPPPATATDGTIPWFLFPAAP